MQAHIKVLLDMKQEGQNVDIVGMNDVWDGNDEVGRGLYPSAKRAGLDVNDENAVTKDYRRLIDRKDIDAVVDRHARPLARQDDHRRPGRRQARLLRKADDPHDRRGSPRGRRPSIGPARS